MSIVLLAYFRGFQPYKPLVLLKSSIIDMVVKSSVLLVLHFVGLSIHLSRAVCHYSYCLQEYKYTSKKQCIVGPTFCRSIAKLVDQCVISSIFCRTINTLVETSLSLILFFVGLLISRDQCVVSPTFLCKNTDTVVQSRASLVLLFVGLSIQWSKAVCCQ